MEEEDEEEKMVTAKINPVLESETQFIFLKSRAKERVNPSVNLSVKRSVRPSDLPARIRQTAC